MPSVADNARKERRCLELNAMQRTNHTLLNFQTTAEPAAPVSCTPNYGIRPTHKELFQFQSFIANWLLFAPTCFNIETLCFLPTQCICVFRVVLTTNSDCFPKQHLTFGHSGKDQNIV
jgi:hypothetical protein